MKVVDFIRLKIERRGFFQEPGLICNDQRIQAGFQWTVAASVSAKHFFQVHFSGFCQVLNLLAIMFLRGFSFRVTHDDKVNVSEK